MLTFKQFEKRMNWAKDGLMFFGPEDAPPSWAMKPFYNWYSRKAEFTPIDELNKCIKYWKSSAQYFKDTAQYLEAVRLGEAPGQPWGEEHLLQTEEGQVILFTDPNRSNLTK